MTKTEFEKFKSYLYTCFPSVREFLYKNSPSAQGTEGIWFDILEPYSLVDCVSVVEAWVKGVRRGFQAYERDQVALLIKQSIEAERDRERRKTDEYNGADRSRFDLAQRSSQEIIDRRRNYQPATTQEPSLREAFQTLVKLKTDCADGNLTQAELYKRKQEILAQL